MASQNRVLSDAECKVRALVFYLAPGQDRARHLSPASRNTHPEWPQNALKCKWTGINKSWYDLILRLDKSEHHIYMCANLFWMPIYYIRIIRRIIILSTIKYFVIINYFAIINIKSNNIIINSIYIISSSSISSMEKY